MLDVLQDTIIDSLKLLPFLFVAYLIMEYIEHKISDKSKERIQKSGKFGPFFGSLLGLLPQCGFSVATTNLFAARIISLGTLIAVYLSTSDEMLPILISEAAPVHTIITILALKFVIGMIYGFLIDLLLRKKNKYAENKIVDICEEEHCDCEHGILKSALKHTISVFIYIFIFTLIINTIVWLVR